MRENLPTDHGNRVISDLESLTNIEMPSSNIEDQCPRQSLQISAQPECAWRIHVREECEHRLGGFALRNGLTKRIFERRPGGSSIEPNLVFYVNVRRFLKVQRCILCFTSGNKAGLASRSFQSPGSIGGFTSSIVILA
jgi:hypothetical protein